MTICLIVLIIFLFVWLNDSANKKNNRDNYKKSTITDVKTEISLYAKWVDIIDNELKKVIENYSDWTGENNFDEWSPIDVLDNLYLKYDIPYIYFNEDIKEYKERRDEAAIFDFKHQKEMHDMYDYKWAEEWRQKMIGWWEEWNSWTPPATLYPFEKFIYDDASHPGEKRIRHWDLNGYPLIKKYLNMGTGASRCINKKNEEALIKSKNIKDTICPFSEETYHKLKTATPVFYIGELCLYETWEDKDIARLRVITSFSYEEYKEEEQIQDRWTSYWAEYESKRVERRRQGDFRPGKAIVKYDQTTYSYILFSHWSFDRYHRLIKFLVRKELAGYGFNPSPNIVEKRESSWQEAENRHKRFEDQKKNYPWL